MYLRGMFIFINNQFICPSVLNHDDLGGMLTASLSGAPCGEGIGVSG